MIGKPPPPPPPPARNEDFAPPWAFGIPEKFSSWRPGQVPAIMDVMNSRARFFGMSAPTGFGKSLAYTAISTLRKGRTIILTSTKGLQHQLVADFESMGMVDMRGQANYQCIAAPSFGYAESTSCADGPCHSGVKCDLRDNGCLYYDQYRRANTARLVVTNYSYWLHINRYGEGLGDFDQIILDEAHDAPDELASFLGVELDVRESVDVGLGDCPRAGAHISDWADWAKWAGEKGAEQLGEAKSHLRDIGASDRKLVKHISKLKKFVAKMSTLSSMRQEWIVEYVDQKGNQYVPKAAQKQYFKFDPLWPQRYAEQYLFLNTPNVLLVSATIRPKTASLLGIKYTDLEFREYLSTFPISRRPVVWVPTIQLNHRTPPDQIREWLGRIYQIVRGRTDRKGIIHSVSYQRSKLIVDNAPSDIRGLLVGHTSADTGAAIARHKFSHRPQVLVSPAITTGYDFPYEQCEYQIICKLPFPDNRGAIIKARMEHDKEYSNYMTMQTLVQACGRPMRAEDDQCETLIVDDNIRWFIHSNKRHAPDWWMESYRPVRTIPQPLPKLVSKV